MRRPLCCKIYFHLKAEPGNPHKLEEQSPSPATMLPSHDVIFILFPKTQPERVLLDSINIRNLISNQAAHNFLISSD